MSNKIHEAFISVVGLDQYKRFIVALFSDSLEKKRLFYWQQEIWEKFIDVHPNHKMDFDQMLVELRWCYWHDSALQNAEEIKLPQKPPHSICSRFPFALGKFCCTHCIDELEAWHKRPRPYSTPDPSDDYDWTLQSTVEQPASYSEFGKPLEVGDEIWAFCSPPITWQGLHGTAGLALRRKGEVIASVITMLN